jgi:hypothetical protein
VRLMAPKTLAQTCAGTGPSQEQGDVTNVSPTVKIERIQKSSLARNLRTNARHALSDELYGNDGSHSPPTATTR